MSASSFRPMLAESVTMADLPKYAKDANWIAQNKADGQRYLIVVEDGKIEVLNRSGQPKTTNLSHAILGEFEDAFGKDKGLWIFDGELVNNQLLLFDIAAAPNYIGPQKAMYIEADGEVGFTTVQGPITEFEGRYELLELLLNEWRPDPQRIQLLPCARTETEKIAMAKAAENERREGIMLRRRSGLYLPGTRSRELLKCKFVKEVDAIVTAVGVDGHDNVVLSLLDPENDRVVEIGRASAIGKRPTPRVGDIWETKYLYLVDPADPRLYQPRLVRLRGRAGEDGQWHGEKQMHECLYDQVVNSFTDRNLNLTKNRWENM